MNVFLLLASIVAVGIAVVAVRRANRVRKHRGLVITITNIALQ